MWSSSHHSTRTRIDSYLNADIICNKMSLKIYNFADDGPYNEHHLTTEEEEKEKVVDKERAWK